MPQMINVFVLAQVRLADNKSQTLPGKLALMEQNRESEGSDTSAQKSPDESEDGDFNLSMHTTSQMLPNKCSYHVR